MNWYHIWLLFANNWLYKHRQYLWLIFELIIPLFVAILCAWSHGQVPVKTFDKPTRFDADNIQFKDIIYNRKYMYYTPKTPATDELFRSFMNLKHTKISHTDSRCTRIVGYRYDRTNNISAFGCRTEADAISYSNEVKRNESHYGGQLFVLSGRDGPIKPGATLLPRKLNVKLRPLIRSYLGTGKVFPEELPRYPECNVIGTWDPSSVLMQFYGTVAKYWLKKRGEDVNKSNWILFHACMPWPPYKLDEANLIGYLPMITIFTFILFAIRFTTILIREKASKIKEVLLMMGVQPSSYWMSWFLTALVYHLLPLFLLYTLILSGNVLENTDPSLFFVVLCVWGFAYVTFCFMVSSLVQNDNIGALLSLALFYASVHWFLKVKKSSRAAKLVSCLGFNSAMLTGLTNIAAKSGSLGTGMRWSNIHEPAAREKVSLLECIIFLLLDAFLHALIAWYIDQVMPTSIGVSKHPLFFLKKHYWLPDDSGKVESIQEMTVKRDPRYFETEPNRTPGIQIRNLRKVFGSKAVVDEVNLDMHEDQITVLLGHNGAGKTVTMSMLTGFLKPTSGTAIINGYDICKDMVQVRKCVGVCPQFNILYPYLTVMEHLTLFSRIKGTTGRDTISDCVGLCDITGLQFKKNAYSSTLSGGQKRMLSVAISLVGGSKIVILDEPSAGMDVAIRRQTWDVLKKAKQGRTIMMTTHYMDEADALGDRIAIMSEGKIKCCGSSLFLKKLYGSGYHLVLSTMQGCNADKILEQVQTKIPQAKLERVVMNEISIELPETSAPKFPALFDQLERDKAQLGIGSFGIGTTSMEEVFIRSATCEPEGLKRVSLVTPITTPDNANVGIRSRTTLDDTEITSSAAALKDISQNATAGDLFVQNDSEQENDQLLYGFSYAMHSLSALLVKRIIQSMRDVYLPLIVIIVPISLGFLVISAEIKPFYAREPNLRLDISMFDKAYVPYGVYQSKKPFVEETAQIFAGLFKGKSQVALEKFSASFDKKPFAKTLMLKVDEFGLEKAMIEMPIAMAFFEDPSPPSDLQMIAWHGTAPLHASTVSIVYALRVLLKRTLDDSFDIESSLHPVNQIAEDDNDKHRILLGGLTDFFYSFNFMIVLAIVAVYAAYVVIEERRMGIKHLQLVSGAGPVAYWCSNFIYDVLLYLITLVLLLPAFYTSDLDVWTGSDGKLGLMFLTMFVYGVVIHCVMYSIGFFVDKASSAILVVVMINLFGSCLAQVVFYVARMIAKLLNNGNKFYQWVEFFCSALLPGYNLMRITTTFKSNYEQKKVCDNTDCTKQPTAPCCPMTCQPPTCVEYDDYLPLLIALLVEAIVLTVFIFLMEYHVFDRIMYLVKPFNITTQQHLAEEEDYDVALERKRLVEKSLESLTNRGMGYDTVNVVNLYKAYGRHLVVNNICMGIPKGECFGLLGQNGAGKTSTFKMMSGEVLLSSGKAYVMGYDATHQVDQVQRNIGYCPQFDGLFLNLTAREALTLIAKLRGIQTKDIPSLIDKLTTILIFQDYVDIKCGLYSGGTKRKLNVAQTLVGRPPVLFLDEPSWGMDPEARRHMWDTLGRYRNEGTTLVLTSHSMEECEALCTRMGIMVNGQFKCLGSSQHLKSRFGTGYSFTIQLTAPDGQSEAPADPVIEYVTTNLPGSEVFDAHENYIHFQAPYSCTLGGIFKFLEGLKGSLNVSDYSVQQTSLEQIFLSFAKYQVPPTTIAGFQCCKCCSCCCC